MAGRLRPVYQHRLDRHHLVRPAVDHPVYRVRAEDRFADWPVPTLLFSQTTMSGKTQVDVHHPRTAPVIVFNDLFSGGWFKIETTELSFINEMPALQGSAGCPSSSSMP